MDTPDNDTFDQLLEAIKEMNRNLEAATFAINNMTMQLNSVAAKTAESLLPQPYRPKETTNGDGSGDATPCIATSDEEEQPRTLGYINWDSSHEILKSQCLIKMAVIRGSLKKLISGSGTNGTSQQLARTTQNYGSNNVQPTTYSGCFGYSNIVKPVVDREIRFPQDAVYVDVSSPRIQKEIKFMNEINVVPTDGVIDRFLKIVESEIQTCETFEKQYGLKWA